MNLVNRDQAVIWHPFTQHHTAAQPLAITRGQGAYLFDEKGKSYLDLISSWWVNSHGHSHPAIADAIYAQAMTLEHVLFAGFTHEPAVLLAESLLDLLPTSFAKIFYSDNGSTAVEIALKMAYQYWHNQGKPERKRFIAFEHGYHGDTFGAMSVGKKSGFFSAFSDFFFNVDFFAYPATWTGDPEIQNKEDATLDQIRNYLQTHAATVAGIIIEPLVQGAGGMRMCTPRFLQKLAALVQPWDILIIYDEVMTGFGRTGDYFACLKAETTPDIICLAKGLTGGFLPLAVTACRERIYATFLGDRFAQALAHGHSFTANPLGCAAALASLQLLQHQETQAQIALLEKVHDIALQQLRKTSPVTRTRFCGTIAAFDLTDDAEYGSERSYALGRRFIEQGLLIRPIGNTVYLMPPYCISVAELQSAYEKIELALQGVTT